MCLNIFRCSFVSFLSGLQRFISFGPRWAQSVLRTISAPFGSTILTPQFGVEFQSHPLWGPHTSLASIFLLFLPRLMQWYLIVAAHHSVRCFLASRVIKKKTLFLVKSRCCLFRWRDVWIRNGNSLNCGTRRARRSPGLPVLSPCASCRLGNHAFDPLTVAPEPCGRHTEPNCTPFIPSL